MSPAKSHDGVPIPVKKSLGLKKAERFGTPHDWMSVLRGQDTGEGAVRHAFLLTMGRRGEAEEGAEQVLLSWTSLSPEVCGSLLWQPTLGEVMQAWSWILEFNTKPLVLEKFCPPILVLSDSGQHQATLYSKVLMDCFFFPHLRRHLSCWGDGAVDKELARQA